MQTPRFRWAAFACGIFTMAVLTATLHAEPKPTGRQDAAQLLETARKALAYTVKSARAAGDELASSNPNAKPFLQSLKKIGTSLDKAQEALEAKSPDFFRQLAAADAGVAEMQATWPLTGCSNKDVVHGGRALGGAVTALSEGYSPLGKRAEAGSLSAAEKARFAKIKQEQAALAAKLQKLRAANKSNKALAEGIDRLLKQSKTISTAPDTGAAYAAALGLLPVIAGWVDGYSYYVPASQRSEWVSFSSYTETWESFYSEEITEESVEWSSLEESVETYDSYEMAVSSEEMEAEESYLEEANVETSDEELNEIAEEAEEMSADEADDSAMESEQEEVAEEADDSAMDDGGSAEGGDAGMDEGGDDGGGGGDDGGE